MYRLNRIVDVIDWLAKLVGAVLAILMTGVMLSAEDTDTRAGTRLSSLGALAILFNFQHLLNHHRLTTEPKERSSLLLLIPNRLLRLQS